MDEVCGGEESLVAAASPLCILSPTNRAEQSRVLHTFLLLLHSHSPSVQQPACVHEKDAASVFAIISAEMLMCGARHLSEACVWSCSHTCENEMYS